MKLIKAGLIGLLGLSILVTLISLLIPSEVHGRRGIVIKADSETIREQIAVFYNWKNWNPEFKANADKLTYKNVSLGQNPTCNLTVNGRSTNYSITRNNAVFVRVIQQKKGQHDIENTFTFSKDSATGGTYVDWKFIGTLKWYPWEKFAGMFTESMTAPVYEMALENLKQYAESH
jgi:Polyketide cyclase / dehydrase and lipid transport